MIKSLIEAGGLSTVRRLAINFLTQDESQILYYEKRLKEMPIKVLSKHGIISKKEHLIRLNITKLSLEQRAELKKIYEQKIQEYIASRGLAIWDYRLLDYSPVPDSLRYRVLKEAKGRCASCGVTKDERPLDIDHITPRSKGGQTVYENLQALCSKCNRSKRNEDDTDFRKIIDKEFLKDCLFCNLSNDRKKIIENDQAYAVPDKYPVSSGHTLVITRRHFSDYFDITKFEQDAVYDLIRMRRKQLQEKDSSIQGFNIGVNSGEVAGQNILHCHIHLIPRRKGDTENPRGGVRGVIPSRMNY